MANVQYDRTTTGGLKLAEHVNDTLEQIDESASLKALANSCTMDGTRKEMLEVGFAASLVELVIDQSYGGSPGNVSIGDTYTGDTSSAVGTIKYQDDVGSVMTMWLENVTGTFQLNEGLTGSNGNTAQVDIINTLGGSDNKFPGEVVFGAEAGSGAALYDAIVAATDGLTALRDEYVDLFQGG